jgi:hypothetical protein
MKKALLTLAIVTVGTIAAHAQVLTDWTFEGTASSTALTATDFTYGPADSGAQTTGSLSTGHHASTATVWSFPAGNGSVHSFSSNNWAVGDYWQFTLDTSTYSGLTLGWDQAGSGTGPRDFRLAYSSDGGTTFSDFTTYSVILSGFSTGSTNTAAHHSFDLSSITALDNNPNVVFRLIDNSTSAINGTGAVQSGGTDRVDNFTVSTTVVPEPSVIGMVGLGATLLMGAIRYRRRGV